MNRRTFEGPMDWEYQDQGPVDMSSPFAKLTRGQTCESIALFPPLDTGITVATLRGTTLGNLDTFQSPQHTL
jgi:hypothetical protein